MLLAHGRVTLKGILHLKIFFALNLIFGIIMSFGSQSLFLFQFWVQFQSAPSLWDVIQKKVLRFRMPQHLQYTRKGGGQSHMQLVDRKGSPMLMALLCILSSQKLLDLCALPVTFTFSKQVNWLNILTILENTIFSKKKKYWIG